MRPSHPAPHGASPKRKEFVSLEGDAVSPRPRRQPPAPRTDTGSRTQRIDVRHAEARSSEGEVHFFLQRIAGGLYVEREEVPRRGTRTSQSLVFESPASFERWCSDDPVRFRHPLLHAQLRRDGDALWTVEP